MRLGIGVMVYNEAENLGRLLEALRRVGSPRVDVAAIVVVSSGCTDSSITAAREAARRDPRIRIVVDPVRRGKATAVNQFLASVSGEVDVCVLLGGDLLPTDGAVEELAWALADPEVGMCGGRPVPTNRGRGLVDRIVALQWDLHHRVSQRAPKMGEMIAFRADVPRLAPDTAVDEAYLEWLIRERHQEVAYVPDAVVLNHGPTRWRELFEQRRRIWIGHWRLRATTGHAPSTMSARTLAHTALAYLIDRPVALPLLVTAAAVELSARAAGTWDAVVKKKNPYVWPRLASTKRPAAEPPPASIRASSA